MQVYVSRLRKALAWTDGLLVTRGHGYLLQVDPAGSTRERFEGSPPTRGAALEAGDPRHAVDAFDAALGLWRGPPLADLAYESFAQSEIAPAGGLRLAALEMRIEARSSRWGHTPGWSASSRGSSREHPYARAPAAAS